MAVIAIHERERAAEREARVSLPEGNVRALEGYLYNYAAVRRDLAARRVDIASSGDDYRYDPDLPRVKGHISDPTPHRALLLTEDEQIRLWSRVLRVIDAVRLDYAIWPARREVLHRWYGLPGRPKQHYNQIARELGLSPSTVRRYRDQMLGLMLWHLHWTADTEDEGEEIAG